MTAPKPGERYLDKNSYRVVIYIGDCGHGPRWEYADDGTGFYCDWLDFYLWKRFQALR
jgi:hypothetical protein